MIHTDTHTPYRFLPLEKCNMCGQSLADQKVLGTRLNQSQGFAPQTKTGVGVTIVRCPNCDLVFPNPIPIPEKFEQHYDLEPEDFWTEAHFKKDTHCFDNRLKTYQALGGKPGKALDIGSGIGQVMLALEAAGFEAHGLEPAESFYQHSLKELKKDRLQCAPIETAQYPKATFDFVTFGAVLEHLYDPSASILKALDWLRPGGLIHIEVPSSKWLVAKLLNSYFRLRGTAYVTHTSPMHAPFHLYEFGLGSFEQHAQKHHYEIAKHQFSVCETLLPKSFDFLLKPIMKLTHTGMQLEIWLRRPKELP